MKNLKLFLIPILFVLGIAHSFGQDVESSFSWVTAAPSTSNSIGFFQCGGVNVTLTSGSPHQAAGTSAHFPTGGPLMIPITLTFSKPVCNLGLLIRDLDMNTTTGAAHEWIEFTSGVLPIGLNESMGGSPFELDYISGVLTAFPLLHDDAEAWVNWDEPLTSVTFQYHRDSPSWGFLLDSLRFDCDCSIPTNLNCCPANGRQMLSWEDVPGAVGYQIQFGFNDTTSGCCTSATDPPTGWLENVADNAFVVPESFADCFWWSVRTQFADGSFSDWSERLCDCFEDEEITCDAPINLDCEMNSAGQKLLSWDPVAGAMGYEISRIYNDPTCCPVPYGPIDTVIVNTTSTFISDTDPNACFAWKVRAICSDDPLYSEWSITKCSSDCSYPTVKAKIPGRYEYEDGVDITMTKVEMTLVPNPAKDNVTITVSGHVDETTNGKAILSIKDIQGSEVHQQSITINESQNVDLKSLKPGIYLCDVLQGGNLIVTSRLVIH